MNIIIDKKRYLEELSENLKQKLSMKNITVVNCKEIQSGKQLFLLDQNSLEELILNIYCGKEDFCYVPNRRDSQLYLEVVQFAEELRNKINVPFSNYIGTDESGKGDYFGPLVVAGFFTNVEVNSMLCNIGVKDSKKLEDGRILEIADIITREFPDRIMISNIFPERYNELYSHFSMQGKNLNFLLAWGHSQVIEKLLEKNQKAEGVLADQFGDSSYIEKSLLEKGRKLEIMQATRAEQDMAVAASSIIARSEFLKWLDFNKKVLNIEIPKGADEEAKKSALMIARSVGIMELKKYVKLHFKTTKEILNRYNKEKAFSGKALL